VLFCLLAIATTAQQFFASRLIAEAPGLKTHHGRRPWPPVAAAVLVCGGSYEAYRPDGSYVEDPGLPPSAFFPNASLRAYPGRTIAFSTQAAHSPDSAISRQCYI
jgi:hypothetical protein